MNEQGIDISHYQGHYNSQARHWDFVVVKVSEGKANYRSVADVGEKIASRTNQMVAEFNNNDVRGAYHYMRRSVKWHDQINKYLEATADLDLHFDVPDLEDGGNNLVLDNGNRDMGRFDEYLNIAHEWTKHMEGLGRKVIPYMNWWFYHDAVKKAGHTWLQKRPIWLAMYPYNHWVIDLDKTIGNIPLLPDNREPLIWQYSDKAPGKEWGVTDSMSLDVNVWNGDMDKWLGTKNPFTTSEYIRKLMRKLRDKLRPR